MGGYGSGRWGRHRAKGTTDPLPRLDVHHLARLGLIVPGAVRSLAVAWSRGDEPAGDILVRYDDGRPHEVVLEYRVRKEDDEAWRPVRESVGLDRTPCPYGGKRPWFLCPRCLSRRAVLFGLGGRFRCRACHGLAYPSTREGTADRHRRRADELRRRLGGKPGDLLVPRKPKGMHRRTYERLAADLRAREVAFLIGFGAETDAMVARIERRYGPLPGWCDDGAENLSPTEGPAAIVTGPFGSPPC